MDQQSSQQQAYEADGMRETRQRYPSIPPSPITRQDQSVYDLYPPSFSYFDPETNSSGFFPTKEGRSHVSVYAGNLMDMNVPRPEESKQDRELWAHENIAKKIISFYKVSGVGEIMTNENSLDNVSWGVLATRQLSNHIQFCLWLGYPELGFDRRAKIRDGLVEYAKTGSRSRYLAVSGGHSNILEGVQEAINKL